MFDNSSRKIVSDSKNRNTDTLNIYQGSTLAAVFFSVIILMAILFLIHGSLRYQQYEDSRKILAVNVVKITGNEIENLIVHGDKDLSHFVKENMDSLKKVVMASGSNTRENIVLLSYLKEYFPDASNFNLVDVNGDLLIPDQNDLVGEQCVKDALVFTQEDQGVMVSFHPKLNHYHYDLMIKILIDEKEFVLIVSQSLDYILNVLNDNKVQGLTVTLLNQTVDNLIDVTEYLVNDQDAAIISQVRIEQEEYASRAIRHSRWQLHAYTDGQLENIFMQSLIKQLLVIYAGFILIVVLIFIYILRLNNNRAKLLKKIQQQEKLCNDQHLSLPIPYESVDSNFNIRIVNQSWCEMLGYKHDEVIGQPFINFLSPESNEKLQANFSTYLLDGGIDHDTYSLVHKNGESIEVDVFSRFEYDTDGEFLHTNSILTNLTEEKHANKHIKTLELRNSMHWRQTMVGFIEWDNELRVIDWSPAAEVIFGFTKTEVLGLKAADFILPASVISSVEQVRQALLMDEGGDHEVNKNLTKDNREITCEWFNAVMRDEANNVIGISSLVMDISLHIESLEIARQHKLELDQLIDSMVDAVITIDEKGIILSFNRSAEKTFGFSADNAIGQNVKILMPEPDRSQHDQYLENYLTGGDSKPIAWSREFEGKRKNGDVFPMRLSVCELPLKADQRRRFVGSCADISEHRKMEEALRQSRKLDAIGEMAGGIAHDFNNLLGIISGNLEVLRRYSGDNADMNKWIDSGLKTTERGTTLTRSLLGFSRVDAGEVKTVSLSHKLVDMADMIEKTAGLNVVVNFELADNLWLTDIDAGDFEDAIINMVINAKDAMQAEGKIDIVAYNEALSEHKISYLLGCKAGDYIVLAISDSGPGISQEKQQRIFDPFYSTKGKGKGTGLGLSMVHGFVRRSHGAIDVRSELGAGAAFYIYLPRSVNSKLETAEDETKELVPVGTETILIVDDEPQLVEVASIYLGDLGYKILQATDTEQAMTFLQGDEKIDMLFTDIIMPGGKDGYELSEDALELCPEIKVLLVSGYTPEHGNLSVNARYLAARRLNKPYSRVELAQRVRLALDGEN